MKRKILLVIMAMCSVVLSAQTLDISGTVTDSSGESLIGASVIVQGTTTGTVTDFDGQYVLTKVPADAVLEISYMGYETRIVPVEGRAQATISRLRSLRTLTTTAMLPFRLLRRKSATPCP